MTRQELEHELAGSCEICGDAGYSTSYSRCAEKERMDRDGICFICAFWELRAEGTNPTVFDGVVYTPGNRTKGRFRGMAGRRFGIEYFGGKRVTTYDLWCGGAIPERWLERIPDTARFLHGARKAEVGGILCFDGSAGQEPPYPLPKAGNAA